MAELTWNRPKNDYHTDHHEDDRHVAIGSVPKLAVMEQTAERSLDVFAVKKVLQEKDQPGPLGSLAGHAAGHGQTVALWGLDVVWRAVQWLNVQVVLAVFKEDVVL